jgi:aspartyl protease family protein
VQLGGIELRDVPASINPFMPEDTVLLGMSFMQHLEMVQRDGQLTLRIPR